MSDPDSPLQPVGVLFVHGIGEQRESESVRDFAGTLVRWLEWWYQARPSGSRPEVVAAHLSYGGGLRGPARVEIRIPAHTAGEERWPERRWIVAEGWWAARISPPGLARMVQWARRSAGRTLARLWGEAADRVRLILMRLGRPSAARQLARSDPGVFGAVVELLSTVLLALLYVLALPFAYVAIAVLLLVSTIPIERLRSFTLAKLIEPFLVEGLGDFATYLEDDIQGLHIRASIEEDVRWLVEEAGCEDVVIVAHSHGTVVAFDALAAGRLPHAERVRKLITVGSALNNAWTLHGDRQRMRATLPAHVYWLDIWSYYDPVPGGQLFRRTPGAPPLVVPGEALRAEMRWYEEYVLGSDVSGPARTPPSSAMPRQVTNEMNVVTDHGGYWRNPEQVLARLAAEIDVPRGYYQRSRFHLDELWRRTRRRRIRVTTQVGWRLATMLAFLAAVAARVGAHGWERLAADGRGVSGWVSALPGAALLALPAQLADGLRRLLAGAADGVAAVPALAAALRGGADWLGAPAWQQVWDAMLGVALFAAVFALLHLALLHALYRPWDEREARESVAPDLPPHRPAIVPRTLAVLAALAVAAFIVASPTP